MVHGLQNIYKIFMNIIIMLYHVHLVGGLNPSEKYESIGMMNATQYMGQ